MMIEYHADDYGMFPMSSRRIIDCINNGRVNAISLMANSPYLPECVGLLEKECKKDVRLSMHLNIITEKPLSPPSSIPDLVDKDGFFNVSYSSLIKMSLFLSVRKRCRQQIKTELGAQIDRLLPFFDKQGNVRIDSHRHFHMVPLVFGVLQELIREKGMDVSYIRIINEKPALYRGLTRFEYFSPLNILKVLLLNFFSFIDRVKYPELYGKGTQDFGSILFSGYLTKKNLRLLLKNIENNPSVFNRDVELMFHPGRVLEKEDIASYHDAEDRKYMPDKLRSAEAEALKAAHRKRYSMIKYYCTR